MVTKRGVRTQLAAWLVWRAAVAALREAEAARAHAVAMRVQARN